MTRAKSGPAQGSGPVRVDAALRETVALLELVRQEEQVLAQLARCVMHLRAIRRARAALADRTPVELDEAACCSGAGACRNGLPSSQGPGR